MSKGKCRDKAGVVLEIIHAGGNSLHETLLGAFNNILASSRAEIDSYETFFTMLPKTGELKDAAN